MSFFGVCRLFSNNQSFDWKMFPLYPHDVCIDWLLFYILSVSALHCIRLFHSCFTLFSTAQKAGKRSTWMHRIVPDGTSGLKAEGLLTLFTLTIHPVRLLPTYSFEMAKGHLTSSGLHVTNMEFNYTITHVVITSHWTVTNCSVSLQFRVNVAKKKNRLGAHWSQRQCCSWRFTESDVGKDNFSFHQDIL